MNIGDRVHIAPGAAAVVVIREIRDAGLVLVENETTGTGIYPYLAKPDHFTPATTETPHGSSVSAGATAETADREESTAPRPDESATGNYLDELNNA